MGLLPDLPRGEIPDAASVYAWIERIFGRGVRRPATAADRWTERFVRERFERFGLERVRLEPVTLLAWRPRAATLEWLGASGPEPIPCFALPYSAPTSAIELELIDLDREPEGAAGRAALQDVSLMRLPALFPVSREVARPPGLPQEAQRPAAGRVFDPEGSLEGTEQVLPFSVRLQQVLEPALQAGAAAFVGALSGYPGGGCHYYVPYDAVARAIPGVWIRASDGARLRAALERGRVRVRIAVEAELAEVTCANVVGELPGADDAWVVVGSHHDGPWSSAVEDASGVALVLAQAAYWASVAREERPHRMVFLVNAGHMAGGAGCQAFLRAHADELERIVLEVHLEHAALEARERGAELETTGRAEPRWLFTTCHPDLEDLVWEGLASEGLGRSLVLPPDAFGPRPTSDGGFFHEAGVPLVNYLTAPWYLFDPSDTLDKVDRESLVPVTRFAARLLAATRGLEPGIFRASA